MALLTTIRPKGWMPWKSVDTYTNSAITPYGSFPESYLPASNFWGKTVTSHCDLPVYWSVDDDPYATFLRTGGSTGIAGSLAGLRAVGDIYRKKESYVWSLSSSNTHLPPTTGYCVGDAYKENTYFFLSAVRIAGNNIVSRMYSDVFQRSRIKRIYVQHGEIDGVRIVEEEKNKRCFITIGLHEKMDARVLSSFSGIGDSITVYSKEGSTKHVIKAISEFWEIEIQATDTPPTIGSFFTLEKVWCIEDPLLINGIWKGNENSNRDLGDGGAVRPVSGYNLHVTDYSYPYNEIKFVGTYVFKKAENVIPVDNSKQLKSVKDGEWVWISYKEAVSEIYGTNPERLKENVLFSQDVVSTDGTITKVEPNIPFKTGGSGDLKRWIDLPNVSYVRMEINKGGSSKRQNWHAPILSNCWLKQKDRYFKIIGQPNGNVIDIMKKDVTGTVDIDTSATITSSILNQFAWIINEHYMKEAEKGFLYSKVKNATYNKEKDVTSITMSPEPVGGGTTATSDYMYNASYLNYEGSFFNRFTMDPNSEELIPPQMRKCYVKNQRWNLSNGSKNYKIITASGFETVEKTGYTDTDPATNTTSTSESSDPASPSSTQSLLNISVIGDASGESIVYITFDSPYKKYINIKNTLSYELSAGVAALVQNTLCLSAEYLSAPISEYIEEGAIVGAGGGRWWGFTEGGGAILESKINYAFTVKDVNNKLCVAAMYNKLIQEDCVGYRDPYSNKMTLRRGFLGFKEIPRKMEVSVGNGKVESISGTEIAIDKDKGRLKSIQFETPVGEDSNSTIMLTIKNKTDYWGNFIRGNGKFNLVGINSLDKKYDSSSFKFRDYLVSPIYVYKKIKEKCYYSSSVINIGLNSTDSPINIIGGDVKNVSLEYVEDKQTLENYNIFDWYKLKDGEDIIVYGHEVNNFLIDKKQVNYFSEDGKIDNLWDTNDGVFIIGSYIESILWGCPIAKEIKNDFQYPLLVLPSCELMGSVFDSLSNKLYIFAKGYMGEDKINQNKFIGVFVVEVQSLTKNLIKCTRDNKKYLDFLLRVPNLPKEIIKDESQTFATKICLDSIIKEAPQESKDVEAGKTAAEEDTSEKDNYDFFARIFGNATTKSQIEIGDIDSIKGISPFILPNGILCVLYDSNFGVRLAYTKDRLSWSRSTIVMAKEARSPVFIDEDAFAYITAEGTIEVKVNIKDLILKAMGEAINKGNTDESLETEQIQAQIDYANIVIVSGQEGNQRMSGYKTQSGIYRLFFYYTDSKSGGKTDILGCMESSDKLNWKAADNF